MRRVVADTAETYASATSGLKAIGSTRLLQRVIAILAVVTVASGLAMQFQSYGPDSTIARSIQAAVCLSGLLFAFWWWTRPWPDVGYAIAFLIYADLAMAISLATYSSPVARLCATTQFAVIGIFAALLLGRAALFTHCVFVAALIAAFIAVAVVSDGYTVSDLYIFYTPALVTVVLLPILLQFIVELLRSAGGRLAHDAIHDPLTGVLNRRGLYIRSEQLLVSLGDTLTVLVIDVDKFKRVNDTLGHAAGDEVLVQLAQNLQRQSGDDDVVARSGGEEFTIVTTIGTSDLVAMIERIRRAPVGVKKPLTVTLSMGVATVAVTGLGRPVSEHELSELHRRADRSMYVAKAAGGNSAEFAVTADLYQ